MSNKQTKWTESIPMVTKHQCSMIVMLMTQLFGGDKGRKIMLSQYFGKKSTKDFTYQEAQLAIELLLNHNQGLKDFYAEHKGD